MHISETGLFSKIKLQVANKYMQPTIYLNINFHKIIFPVLLNLLCE